MRRLLAVASLAVVVSCGSDTKPLPKPTTWEVRTTNGTLCIAARDMYLQGGSQGRSDHYDFYEVSWGKGLPIAVVPLDRLLSIRKTTKCRPAHSNSASRDGDDG